MGIGGAPALLRMHTDAARGEINTYICAHQPADRTSAPSRRLAISLLLQWLVWQRTIGSLSQRHDPGPSELGPGTLLEGKYRVERVLGRGGMGVVVAAEHLDLRRRVAVKCIRGQVPPSPVETGRFVKEARVAAQLRSENVVHVTDVGTLDSGAPFIVMEYLEGQDLARYLAEQGPLPVPETVGYVMEALVGLAEAHRIGIVHRDLKPSNLFLARRPDGSTIVKILDFGISKVLSAESIDTAGVTTNAGHGSPHYMSPEQIRAPASVDSRTDIWSLGVVLYELLTGERPHTASSISGLAVSIVTEPARPPREVRPELSRDLERVVLRCLQKQPARRYSNVAELAAALAPFGEGPAITVELERIVATVSGGGVVDRSQPLPGGFGDTADTARLATFSRTWTPAGLSRRALWGLVAVILVVIGAVGWFGTRARSVVVRRPDPDAPLLVRPTTTGPAAALPGGVPSAIAVQPERSPAARTTTSSLAAAPATASPRPTAFRPARSAAPTRTSKPKVLTVTPTAAKPSASPHSAIDSRF